MGLIVGKETETGFEPSLLVRWLWPKTASGNTINGLGERHDRPATPVFHRLHKHPFRLINFLFLAKSTWDLEVLASVRRSAKIKDDQKQKMAAPLPVAEAADRATFTAFVKDHATDEPDCDVIGVAKNHENLYFDRELATQTHIPKYAVVIGLQQDYEKVSKNLEPQTWWKMRPWKSKWRHTSDEVMSVYERTHGSADRLATKIRAKGYYAEALGGAMGSAINILRTAIEAGMGELGKHGSILNDTYGANMRFAVVLTDMPLEVDGLKSVGADEFCYSCQLCTTSCPPGAISDRKQLVRGVTRWYVDFDKCMPFFIDTKGCAICITACPWSRPNVAPKLTKKMLSKIQRKEEAKIKKAKEVAELPAAATDQIALRVTEHDGKEIVVSTKPGMSLMAAITQSGRTDGVVASCGGACACATCHVFVDPEWTNIVGGPNDTEDMMLDATAIERTEHSRLSCQIDLTQEMDGLSVRLPERQE